MFWEGSVPPAKVRKTDLEICLMRTVNYFIKSALEFIYAVISLRFNIFIYVSAKYRFFAIKSIPFSAKATTSSISIYS
jgi:hypothetical protein